MTKLIQKLARNIINPIPVPDPTGGSWGGIFIFFFGFAVLISVAAKTILPLVIVVGGPVALIIVGILLSVLYSLVKFSCDEQIDLPVLKAKIKHLEDESKSLLENSRQKEAHQQVIALLKVAQEAGSQSQAVE